MVKIYKFPFFFDQTDMNSGILLVTINYQMFIVMVTFSRLSAVSSYALFTLQ